MLRQFLRRGEDLRRCSPGDAGRFLDLLDIAGHELCALRRLLHIAGDLMGRCALLFHGCGDGVGDLADIVDGAADAAQRLDSLCRRALNFGYLRGDVIRRAACLRGQFLHFGGDDRKAPPRFSRACRLDRRVQREEIGLGRDVVDEGDHVADLLRAVSE